MKLSLPILTSIIAALATAQKCKNNDILKCLRDSPLAPPFCSSYLALPILTPTTLLTMHPLKPTGVPLLPAPGFVTGHAIPRAAPDKSHHPSALKPVVATPACFTKDATLTPASVISSACSCLATLSVVLPPPVNVSFVADSVNLSNGKIASLATVVNVTNATETNVTVSAVVPPGTVEIPQSTGVEDPPFVDVDVDDGDD